MSDEDITFPQYRKYSNNRNFFKIISAIEFEEIYFIGNNKLSRRFIADTYPEKLLIQDLLKCQHTEIQIIQSAEYPGKGN